MKTFLFPGQGSQKKGMGKELFGEFKDLVDKTNAILGYSIEDLCLENTGNNLVQTQYTQVALYVVNALSYYKKTGEKASYLAGHSLGEYNALLAAGAFDFETGLKLVQKRGELMARASEGGMSAVVGLEADKIINALNDNNLNNITIANYNSPSQFVIAGPLDELEQAKNIFEAMEVKLFVHLNVSAAFHSSYMENARKKYEEFIETFHFSPLEVPVISNITARPYDPAMIKKNLAEQITSPVLWCDTILYLMSLGDMEFEQIGPGNVIRGLLKKISNEISPSDVEEMKTKRLEEERIAASEKSTENAVGKTDKVQTAGKQKKNKKAERKKDRIKKNDTSKSLLKTMFGKNEKENNEVQQKKESNKKSAGDGTMIISAESLGSKEFKKDYSVKYAYVTGGMAFGIASTDLVIKIGKAGLLGFFGTGGLKLDIIEEAVKKIKKELHGSHAFGFNVLYSPLEEKTISLLMDYDISIIEAAAYMHITPSLVRYRLKGIQRNEKGEVEAHNNIIAKISRPEIAELFMGPAPERIVQKLLNEGGISAEEAELSQEIPMAHDICVEADSGGHTDYGSIHVLLPAIQKLRSDMQNTYNYKKAIRIGAAGGIGTPSAAAAVFVLGADFIVTGSINQCTVEAGTSDLVKNLLERINVQDTDYAPAGDMFELGAKVQVLKKGVFFPSRANKLYMLYQQYKSIDEIGEQTKTKIEEKYFKRSFAEVYQACKAYYSREEIAKAEKNPKYKMAMIFKWYFSHSNRIALQGDEEHKLDYQINCGPALGAFNQWVKGSDMESWKNRNVDVIANRLMDEAAQYLHHQMALIGN